MSDTDLSLQESVSTSSPPGPDFPKSSSSDSSYCRRRRKRPWSQHLLPTHTLHWKLKHAHFLNIFYDNEYQFSPLEVLEKVENRNELTLMQKRYLDIVKFYLQIENFDFDMSEEVGERGIFYRDRFKPVLDRIIDNIENVDKRQLNLMLYGTENDDALTEEMRVKDLEMLNLVKYEVRNFIFILRRLLKTVEEDKNLCFMVPEINYCELPRKFAELCQLKAWKGKDDPSELFERLGVHKVTCEPDFRLYKTGMSVLNPENPETVATVTVINRDSDQKENKEDISTPPYKKVKTSSCTNNALESATAKPEKQNLPITEIQKRLSEEVLGRHAGELFLDFTRFAAGPKLIDGSKVFVMPGMIIDGTKVYFTVLEMTSRHHQKLLQGSTIGELEEQDRAIIYYSQPLDFLIRDDRAVLLDNFMRLNNIKVMTTE